jgi:hypothetical protein
VTDGGPRVGRAEPGESRAAPGRFRSCRAGPAAFRGFADSDRFAGMAIGPASSYWRHVLLASRVGTSGRSASARVAEVGGAPASTTRTTRSGSSFGTPGPRTRRGHGASRSSAVSSWAVRYTPLRGRAPPRPGSSRPMRLLSGLGPGSRERPERPMRIPALTGSPTAESQYPARGLRRRTRSRGAIVISPARGEKSAVRASRSSSDGWWPAASARSPISPDVLARPRHDAPRTRELDGRAGRLALR